MADTSKPKRRVRIGRRMKKTPGLSKTQSKSVRKIAKSVVLRTAESKAFGFGEENIELYHNKPYYSSNWLSCKQGTADDNDRTQNRLVRIGDELLLKNVNIRLWLSNKQDRPNVMYKAALFWYDSNATLSDTLVYFTQTNKMLDRYNNEQISIIDRKTVFSGAQYQAKEHSYLATLNGNWKAKKIIYDEGGSMPKKRTIGMVVVCYDAYGTLQTDNIASMAYDGKVTIKDL